MDFWILFVAFFFIAMIYASVGFAGGTSYLALMGVMSIGVEIMRPTALICNMVVCLGSVVYFYREKLIDFSKIWPFIVTSVPLAFFGGYYPIKEATFFLILGITLIVAALTLWFFSNISKDKEIKPVSGNLFLNMLLGGGVGFLSGVVSIGGGIFLSPILHFMKWDQARKISVIASIFILVNSISGLVGQLSQSGSLDWGFALPLMGAVLVGGQIGTRLGVKKFNPLYIQRITAVLILVAGIIILIKN